MKCKYILVLNCGSSSIKFAIFSVENNKHIYHGIIDNINSSNCHLSYTARGKLNGEHSDISSTQDALLTITNIIKKDSDVCNKLIAIGHRVVHGGNYFKSATLINQDNLLNLKKTISLAPLHNHANILGIEQCLLAFPKLKNIAVFDTAFHARMPSVANTYAINPDIANKYGIKKYGFHGINHQYVYNQATKFMKNPKANIISAHLGNGASICAIKAGISIDTSMGFTPLAGLVMGTRCGDIDPGAHQFLAKKLKLNITEITDMLNKKSGLLALSKCSYDMRQLEKKYNANDQNAILAINVFCYKVAQYIASYMVPLQTCDAIIFTGGIGENSPFIRSLIISHLNFLNLKLCHKSNNDQTNINNLISQETSKMSIFTIKANEEIMIMKSTYEIINRGN
ncbi:MAG: acetate/propionate family kinase [Legionellales bacterium]|jgi:acetate kinase|nr:acetate/propionate family kinase [Legionellales bacterium]